MKIRSVAFSIIFVVAAAGSGLPAFAADRDATVKQCVEDNKDEGQTAEAVSSYCGCMAGKMGPSESMSVTDWEASHKDAMDSCAAGANWKFD